MLVRFTAIALLAIISTSSAQWQQQQQNRRTCGSCQCGNQYIPFCATDGRKETTYSNRCQFECAQKCNPGLRLKFEGVCAVPYKKDNPKSDGGRGDLVASGSSWGSQSYQTTRRPYLPPTTPRRDYYTSTTKRYDNNPWSTTKRYESYPWSTTKRYENNPWSTTKRYVGYPEPTTRRPYSPYPSYPLSTIRPQQYYPGGKAEPNTIPTTSRPWWQQSQYGQRGSRDVEDDDDDDLDDEY